MLLTPPPDPAHVATLIAWAAGEPSTIDTSTPARLLVQHRGDPSVVNPILAECGYTLTGQCPAPAAAVEIVGYTPPQAEADVCGDGLRINCPLLAERFTA